MSLTDEQNNALKILKKRIEAQEKISILQGAAGTGKSHTLSYLLEELSIPAYNVHFCAFTGNAAKILMDNGMNASTIHKLIYKPIINRGKVVGFSKVPRDELDGLKLIVVDEFSMVNGDLMEDLMSYRIPILLVGDPYQLPPIGKTNQFVNSYHAKLETVMRQALESPVLWAATKLRNGESLKDGVYGSGDESLKIGRRKELEDSWYRKDVQFIVGTNNLRKNINLKVSGSPNPEVGDKIIFLKNDWENFIVNGSKSKIIKIENSWDNKYYLDFSYDDLSFESYYAFYQEQPENFRPNKKSPINVFDKSYAITCHKAQGSTISSPLVVIDESSIFRQYKMNWQYTALTRSSGKKPTAFLR